MEEDIEFIEKLTVVARKDYPQLQAKLKGIEGEQSEEWRVFRVISTKPAKVEGLATCKTRHAAKLLLSRIKIINNELKIG